MDLIDTIVQVLRTHLKTLVWRKHLKFIATQLCFVQVGFKSGFLVDVGPRLPTESWLSILEHLGYSHLVLLEFNDNVCILNHEAYLKASKPCFVDVTKETPNLRPTNESRLTDLMLTVQQKIEASRPNNVVKFEIDPELTPTLFGLLIGYPVVYCFQGHYNLAHQNLQIVEAKLGDAVVVSFSFPLTLSESLAEVISRWKHKATHTYNLKVKEYVKNLDVVILLEKLLEAASYFEKVLSIDPTFLKSYQNLQNLKNQIVEGWHFRMLNDDTRNSAYKKAIKSKVDQQFDNVLDIGTGTGLLSIYTRMAGAKNITACERSEYFVQIASEILKNNRCEDVLLVPKYSTDIVCGKDFSDKFKLIVTEILDSGVFGEGVLQTLIHAKEKLLDVNGTILPSGVKVFIAGFQSETIASQNVVTNSSFQDFIFSDGFTLCSKNDDHYDSLEIRLLTDFKFTTSIGMAMDINFNDLNQMRAHLKGKSGPLVKLTCEDGYIDGFLVWFRLHLCDDIYLETAPQVQNCWNQAIIRVRSRHLVNKHRTINLSMSAMSGILKVSHNLDQHISRVYEIDNNNIRYINDSGYLNALENAILQKLKKRNRKSFEHVLDFSPFPYTGLILLKEHRAKHLYVSNDNEAFVKFLAQKNCIPESCIRFLKTPLDHFIDDANGDLLMDLVILAPFETVGILRADQISVYPTLVSKLKPNGIIVPIKIELYGVLISSEWLVKMSRVNNVEMDDLKISDLVNKYQIENSIDIGEFEYTNLTQTFKISDVELDDQLHETSLSVELTTRDRCIDAILCHYKIQFVANSDMLSSYRKFSHIQRTAFLCPKSDNANGQSHVKVHFVQNHGIIKCYLSS